MSVTDFEQRRKEILGLIIEAYVLSASPVGSELVSKKLRSSLSSATIRNIMVELEKSGYLEQPHTSAGRVQTDRGYRFYVDAVMDTAHLSPDELRQIEVLIQPPELDVEQLLQRASGVLAGMTEQAAFAVSPTVKQRTVKQIELMPLGVRKILRSEEHTSELQSQFHLVCRLLLEKHRTHRRPMREKMRSSHRQPPFRCAREA